MNNTEKKDILSLERPSSNERLKEIRFRVERFVTKNLFVFAFFFLIICLIGALSIWNMSKSMNKMSQVQEISSQSAIGIDNGMVVDLKRDLIKPNDNQNAIAVSLLNLVTSRIEISKKFTQSKFDAPSQIIENSPKLADFFNEFILIHQKENLADDERKNYVEFEKNGIGYYKAYLDTLIKLFQDDKLPHIIQQLPYRVPKDEFYSEGKNFRITIEVPIAMMIYSYNPQKQTKDWIPKEGVVVIKAKGKLDIKTRTKEDPNILKTKGLNGLGIHYDWFSVSYPDIKEGAK